MSSMIKSHNKRVINKDESDKNILLRNKNISAFNGLQQSRAFVSVRKVEEVMRVSYSFTPLNGQCHVTDIIYKCTVSSPDKPNKVYIGTAKGDFKK